MLSDKAQALLRKQQERYLVSLPDKHARIRGYWFALQASGWGADELERFKTEIHRLSGSAGSYGLQELGQAAGEMDALLVSGHSEQAQRQKIAEQLTVLECSFEEAIASRP